MTDSQLTDVVRTEYNYHDNCLIEAIVLFATPTLTTDVWFRTVDPTASHLSDEQHLAGPFNFAAAPDPGSKFVGDYEGLTAIGATFHPVFAITPAATRRAPIR